MLTDREGKVLFSSPLRDGLDLGDQDLKGADFRRATVASLNLAGADLREADFSDSDLYWLDLYLADCSDASFRGARFEGANFKSTCLQRVDFTGAVVGRDRLGGPSTFAHADLTGANFERARLVGAEYDKKTIFPSGFDPIAYGMVFVNKEDDSLVEPPCKRSS